ncbi:sucrase ferredoxin [Sphaerisporangium rufum]|uniref:Sucrase ferredoxin n=1 Tax=Sphaerisporangium rufum TaxID=1381558 RepID=A0A919V2B8_9ACTN|nr:sucrase ferredoxin [Sphaerisporangium rufum]GII80594.1 sucrase ferredoxin [Sphaerisporangium rufum]
MIDRRRGCEHPPGCHTGQAPTLASATTKARRWLLVEHAGPWAADVAGSELPATARALVDRAASLGVRTQLIRRPGHRERAGRTAGRPVRVMVADTTAEIPWIAEGHVEHPDDLDLGALVRGVVPESCILMKEPVFLVCTHAKRNACCARLGLPIARVLGESLPGRVWETTHVGGDRYAANLVCLPHGLYYGSMSQAAAIAVANAYRSGGLVLDRYRGRAGIPEPSQAAEHFVRAHTGELSVGGVAVESTRSEGDVTEAVVRHGDVRFRIVIERTAFAPCGTACADSVMTYRALALEQIQCGTPVLT